VGVQGNRYEPGFANKGLLDFDFSDFRKVKDWAEITMDELKEAVRLATQDTASWANKESAKDLGRELQVPYPAMRKRIKVKRRMMTFDGALATARIWYGINALSLKYLKPKQDASGVKTTAKTVPGAFISDKLKQNVFKRKGSARLPIEKQTLDVEAKAASFLQGTFEPKVSAYFLDRFFFYVDRMSGRESGSSAAALGGSINPRSIFERK
jgi:hypothetical protein